MPRDVKKILEDDAKKPTAPGVEEPDDILIDDEGGHVVDDDVAAKPAADSPVYCRFFCKENHNEKVNS